MDHPVPASAHPGVQAAHAAVLGAPHRPWWTHAHPTASFEEQLAAAVAAQAPFLADISEHNGFVNWDLLEQAWRAGLLLAVAMRAGFGTVRADKQFARNQAEARRRGIPNIPYWFCYSAYNTAAAEARMFNATVGPLRPGEAMAGDFEDDPNAKPFLRGAAGLQWCWDFLGALQSPDNATWAYSYSALISIIGLQPLAQRYPWWWADWSRTADSAFPLAAIRQVTDCGSTPGVAGCCDQSRVLKGPLSRWLTPGGGAAPAASSSISGGQGAMSLIMLTDGTTEYRVFLARDPAHVTDAPYWPVHVSVFAGAEGEEEGGGGTDYDLGGLIHEGTLTAYLRPYTDALRLVIEGRGRDDQPWRKIVNAAAPNRLIENWTAIPLGVPVAWPVGEPGPPGTVDDDHIAAVAAAAGVAEVMRRLENG